jgi:DNA-binding FadR family transcriptional regulator
MDVSSKKGSGLVRGLGFANADQIFITPYSSSGRDRRKRHVTWGTSDKAGRAPLGFHVPIAKHSPNHLFGLWIKQMNFARVELDGN